MEFDRLRHPPSSSRAQIEKVVLARKVGLFLSEDKPNGERDVVLQVAEQLARDISLEVRQTLAFELRRARVLPIELADRIARDVEQISGPFLSFSEVFSPDDLARLARELEEHARIAIAQRPEVPDVVAMAIAEVGGERSVTFLIRNCHADMRRAGKPVVERFAANRAMMDQLSERADLSLEVVANLIDKVSEACRVALIEKHGLDTETAGALVADAGASSFVRWTREASRGALNDHIRQLDSRGAITDRLLNDTARHGGIRFFESVVAYRTGIDINAVESLVRAGVAGNIAKLIRKAGFHDERATRLQAAVTKGLALLARD